VRRRRLGATLLGLGILLVLVVSLQPGRSDTHPSTKAALGGRGGGDASGAIGPPAQLVARPLSYALPAGVQDSAAVALGSQGAVLLGGLDGADTSIATVTALAPQGAAAAARLPEAQHDAQAAQIGGRVYVFGGGQVASYSHILAYDPARGSVSQVASLPSATSDAAVAVLAGKAYIVGGYDGRHALDTIVVWSPGTSAAVVVHLPYGLRYAAVAAADGRLLIAGGSRELQASTAIFTFDPRSGALRLVGHLPHPLTHAAAVALGPYVYVLGGRGSVAGSQTAGVLAIDPRTGRWLRAGELPQPLSDAAAVAPGDRVWLAGGQARDGQTLASVLELVPTAPG
jgi:N-acetylneuraminic acid mutarotase